MRWTTILAAYTVWWLAHFIIFFGTMLLIMRLLADIGLTVPEVLRDFAIWLGGVFAASSLFAVSVFIYFEGFKRPPPSKTSKTILAPFFIVVALLYGLVFVLSGATISSQYADAISAIALGGAILRLTGNPGAFENEIVKTN